LNIAEHKERDKDSFARFKGFEVTEKKDSFARFKGFEIYSK
jgi:hypothetical protein